MQQFIAQIVAYLMAMLFGGVVASLTAHAPVPGTTPMSFAAIVIEPSVTITVAPVAVVRLAPAPTVVQSIDDYLCEVYRRTPVKRDGGGDFSWKDRAAAARLGLNTCAYAIGGMNKTFKAALAKAGRQMDERGIRWSIFSGFRDDYRQSIASGFKARTGYSRHGGSRATKGYGDGRAIDIAAVGPIKPVLAFIDQVGQKLGLVRPYRGFDPWHVQMTSAALPQAAKTRYAKQRPPAQTHVERSYGHQQTRKIKKVRYA